MKKITSESKFIIKLFYVKSILVIPLLLFNVYLFIIGLNLYPKTKKSLIIHVYQGVFAPRAIIEPTRSFLGTGF
jgi:hypothetical protein